MRGYALSLLSMVTVVAWKLMRKLALIIYVLFLNDDSARACSVALALPELTRVGEPNCLYGKKSCPGCEGDPTLEGE